MKVKFLICLLFALTYTVSGQTKFSTILAEIENDPFGKAIGQLVQMNMQASPSGRLTAISDLLDSLKAQILTTQSQAKSQYERAKLQCGLDQASQSKAIDDLKQTIKDNKDDQSDLTKEQGEKSQDFASENSNLSQKKTDSNKAQSQFIDENNFYETHFNHFKEAIESCEQAVKLLTQLIYAGAVSRPATFLQIRDDFTKVQQNLQDQVAKSHTAFLEPIIQILTDLSSSTEAVDQTKIQQIITLIQALLDQLRLDQTSLTSAHNKTLQDLSTLISNLEKSIKDSQIVITTLGERLDEIDKKLKALGQMINVQTSLLSTQEEIYQNLQDSCNDNETSYAKAEAKRNTQLMVLQKLIDHFNSKVKSTTENVDESAFAN